MSSIAMANDLICGEAGEISNIFSSMEVSETRLLDLLLLKVKHTSNGMTAEDYEQEIKRMKDGILVTVEEYKDLSGYSDNHKAAQTMLKAWESTLGRIIKTKGTRNGRKVIREFSIYQSEIEYLPSFESDWGLRLKLTDSSIPYLALMAQNYTLLDFTTLTKLNTPTSRKLYGWLRYANGHTYKFKDKETGANIIPVSFDDIKKIVGSTAANHEYLKRRVLDPAVEVINAATNKDNGGNGMTVSYESTKTGRKVTGYRFIFNKVENNFIKAPTLPRRQQWAIGSENALRWIVTVINTATPYLKECHERGITPTKTVLTRVRQAANESGDEQTLNTLNEWFGSKAAK